jgi:nitroreductase
MTSILPPAPEFGAPCPVQPSDETLRLLALRRSSSAQTLIAPGPDAGQLADLLRIAARAPDHGKLFPWRFVVLEGQAKAKFVAALREMAPNQPNPEKAMATLAKIDRPPVTVAVISSPQPEKMPLWEQELSAGAVCMLLLVGAEAMGFGANWITDWYGYHPAALRLLGVREGEKLAGFVHLGTSGEVPLERARPDMAAIVERCG